MMKAECDRCGEQREIPKAPEGTFGLGMPDGWQHFMVGTGIQRTRPDEYDLCGPCVVALRKFLARLPEAAPKATLPPWLERYVHLSKPTSPNGTMEKLKCKDCGWSVSLVDVWSPESLGAWEQKNILEHELRAHTPDGSNLLPVSVRLNAAGVFPSTSLLRCPITPSGCVAHGGPDCLCNDPSRSSEPQCGGFYINGLYAAHADGFHPENPACTECDDPTGWDDTERKWRHLDGETRRDHTASVLLRNRSAEKS